MPTPTGVGIPPVSLDRKGHVAAVGEDHDASTL